MVRPTAQSRLWPFMLLGILQTSTPLQNPGVVPWPSSGTDVLLELGVTSDASPGSLLGRLLPVSVEGHMSPVTWSETSDLEPFKTFQARAAEDSRYCNSIPGSSEAAEWVPPEDWQLPPAASPAADASRLRDMLSMDSDGGLSADTLGAGYDSQALPHSSTSDRLTVSPHGVNSADLASQIVWNRRPMCDVCKLAEASQASVKRTGKHLEWAFYACRFCASPAGLQHQTNMISLRGRCARCPRTATFAPPGCPQHISIHCKEHKWEGEIGKSKRLSGSARRRGRGGLQQQGLSASLTQDAPSEADQSAPTENDESDVTFSATPSSDRASRSDGVCKSRRGHGRSLSVSACELRLARGAQARKASAVNAGRSHSCGPAHSDGRMQEAGDYLDPLCVPSWVWDTCTDEAPVYPDSAQSGLVTGAALPPCRELGCGATAAFGRMGDCIVRSCQEHKGPGEVRLAPRRKAGLCSHSGGCGKRASFGDAQLGVARFCAAHKLSWHTNVRAFRCTALDCARHSTYGPPSSRKPLLCAKHRGEGDVDLRHTRRASPVPVPSKHGAMSPRSRGARELLAAAAQLTDLKHPYALHSKQRAEAGAGSMPPARPSAIASCY